MSTLISIVIPAYNIESLIGKTLDSILAQTYTNIEVIVVDDGSSDNTWKVIGAYAEKDARIKAVLKENGGVTSARLRGVAEAAGEWIGFVDGDDYIEPDMYLRLWENAQKYRADISHCGYQMVFPSRVDYYYNTGKLVQQDKITGLRDLIQGEFVEPGLCNKLYRRDLFLGLNEKMDPSIRINEDVLMNYWLFKAAENSVYEDFCPYHYMVRAGSAANSKLNPYLLRDPLRVTGKIRDDAPEAIQPVVLARLARQLIGGATMTVAVQPELVRPFRKECRKELRRSRKTILKTAGIGRKMKIMTLAAAFWPAGYGLLHRIYARLSGVDRKYEIK